MVSFQQLSMMVLRALRPGVPVLFTALVLVCLAPTVGSGESIPEGRARLVVSREGNVIAVRISVPNKSNPSVVAYKNPARIVVDFPGTRVKKNEALKVPANRAIKMVRVGSHPEKLRVVLDLLTEDIPAFQWSSAGLNAIIRVIEPAGATESAALSEDSAPHPSPAPQMTNTPMPLRTPQPTRTPSIIPTPLPSLEPTPAAPKPTAQPLPTSEPIPVPEVPALVDNEPPIEVEEEPSSPLPPAASASSEQPAVAGNTTQFILQLFRFDYLVPNRTPLLKVMLNRSKAQAQISKVDPKTYRIVVPNCLLAGNHLSLPQFPPADFVGFTMVSAQQFPNKVEITINVEPGVTLGTFVRGAEIWVKRL